MATQRFDGDVEITGALRVSGTYTGPIARSNIITGDTAIYELPFTLFRVWNAMHTNLPTIGSSDDLGLASGTFGSALPNLRTQDMNAAGAVTEYARTMFTLPREYSPASAITLRLAALMITSVASVSATVDAEVYLSARNTLVSGSDLCTTAATSTNLLTTTEVSFTITPTSRVAGDVLDIRIAWIGNSATASSHFGSIAHAEMLVQIKG